MDFVLKERRRRELSGEEQEGRLLDTPLVLPAPLRLEPLEPVDVRGDDLLGVDPHAAEEVFVDHRGLLLLGSPEREVEAVEEPWQERARVPLFCDLKLFL